MARFSGVPIADDAKPRFAGVPVEATAPAASGGITGGSDPALNVPGGPAPAPNPSAPTWLDQLFGAGQYALETGAIMADSARRGASNVAGLPVDLVNASPLLLRLFGVDAQPFSPNPIGGSDWMNDATKGFGLVPDAPAPKDPLQTVAGRVAEEVGATMVPVAGGLTAAARTTLPALRQSAGPLAKHLVEPYAVDAARTVGKEVAAATAAGTGAGLANLAVDRDTVPGQLADFGGAVGGVGLYAAGSGVARGLGELLRAASNDPRYASRNVREKTADTIIANSDVLGGQVNPARPHDPVDTTDLVDLLRRQGGAEEIIPGFKATTADRAGDFGLASLTDARARGPNAGRFRAAMDANTNAVDAALDTYRPTQQPGAFTDALAAERQSTLDNYDADLRDAMAALERATGPLQVPVDSTLASRGNVIRTDLLDARDAARAKTDAAYQAADVSGTAVNAGQLADVIDNATTGLTVAERSVLPNDLLEQVRSLGASTVDEAGNAVPAEPVDIREATTLLSRLRHAQRIALGPNAENGGRDANRVIGQVADALDQFIADNITPAQRDLYETARQAKFTEAESFGRKGDPVAAALQQNEGGRFTMRDDRVAPQFASRDENLSRLFAEADTPATRDAIRNELLTRLDTRTPDAVQNFMAVYRQQIARFPGLADELRQAAAASGGVMTSTTQRDFIRKLFGTPDGEIAGTGAVARYLAHEPSQAERAMSNVLNSKSPSATVDELLSFVGDEPQAVEGARAAFWRVMEKRTRSSNGAIESNSGVDLWLPKKWRAFLDQPNVAAVMDRLYRDNPEHLDQIRQIAEALRTVNASQRAGASINPSGSAQALRNGPITLAEAQAKFIDVQRGRLNPLYAVTYLAGKVANRLVSKQAERAYQMLLDEALLKPEVAAALLEQNNPANRAALARRAKGWLGNEASGLTSLLSAPDETSEDD